MTRFSGFFLKALAIVGTVVLVAAWPAHALSGPRGPTAALAGALAALIGALTGHLARFLLPRGPDALVHGALAGVVVRLLVTLFLALPLFLLVPLPRTAMAMGLVLSYLALLVLEVRDLMAAVGDPSPSPRNPHGQEGSPTR